MKVTKTVKRVMIRKLSDSLLNKLTYEEFNELFLLLDSFNTSARIVPYGMTRDKNLTLIDENSNVCQLFKEWLIAKTSRIGEEFNKGRKMARYFRLITTDYKKEFAFNLGSDKVLMSAISVFYYRNDDLDSYNFLVDEKLDNLDLLREYFMACLIVIDAHEDFLLNSLLPIFMGNSIETLVEDVLMLKSGEFSQL